jgi:cellulose synthase/poly-beta-1,6-N-acetylglucosamine synthase-like glycosyltransferase
MIVAWCILALSFLTIAFAIVGYPLLLIVLDRWLKPGPNPKRTDYEPTVTCLIAAHNEEKVIRAKLQNALALDYPAEKLEILVASDHSTDGTNGIVEAFMREHGERKIRLYQTRSRRGKTNAQNEAQKTAEARYS